MLIVINSQRLASESDIMIIMTSNKSKYGLFYWNLGITVGHESV